MQVYNTRLTITTKKLQCYILHILVLYNVNGIPMRVSMCVLIVCIVCVYTTHTYTRMYVCMHAHMQTNT